MVLVRKKKNILYFLKLKQKMSRVYSVMLYLEFDEYRQYGHTCVHEDY